MTIAQVEYEKILLTNNTKVSAGFRKYDNPNLDYFTVTFKEQNVLLTKVSGAVKVENSGTWNISFDSINDIQQPINFNKVINFPESTVSDPIDYTDKLSTTNLIYSKNSDGKTTLTSTMYSSILAQYQYKYVIKYTMDK